MKTCVSLTCSNKHILSTDNRVEVRTVLPNASTLKKFKTKFQIQWEPNGDAIFHKLCWDKLLKSSRARKIHADLPKLIKEEKYLVKEASKTAEYFDSFDSMKENAEKCARLIKLSTHCTAFTGAGISTSAGIGDYRGKDGKWTQQDQVSVDVDGVFGAIGGTDVVEDDEPVVSKKAKKSNKSDIKCKVEEEIDLDVTEGVPYESLRPTYTHEALYKLMQEGYLKYVISQNGDGLHGLSGIQDDSISELHGSAFLEICEKCHTRYHRSYYVMDDVGSQYYEDIEDHGKSDVKKPRFAKKCSLCGLSHRTGRMCKTKGCRGYLIDSIINFGDNLEEDILTRAEDHAQRSDLMICLGSTLMVTPANSLVEMTKDPHNLAICNRQETYMDGQYGEGVRVFGDCDVFMKEVMKCVLEPDKLNLWEDQRQKRMAQYDMQRVVEK